jgi:SAM-dependent methyltransferase
MDRSLAEAWRVLRPGGTAVFIEPNGRNPFYALIGGMKRAERGVVTANYDKAFQALCAQRCDVRLKEDRFTSYATFHGGALNAAAGVLSKLLVFPELSWRFRSHRVFVLRKGEGRQNHE